MAGFISTQHRQWFDLQDDSISFKLQRPLLAREEDGHLYMNFDKDLFGLFQEARCWSALRYDVPVYIEEVINSPMLEQLRVQRECVLTVVRDYNAILNALDQEERQLFASRMQDLDDKVNYGISNLSWSSSQQEIREYIEDTRASCVDLHATVQAFHGAGSKIEEKCRLMSCTLLVHIEKQKVYESGEFEAAQVMHRQEVAQRFQAAHNTIQTTLAATYETFAQDPAQVQQEWTKLVAKVDTRLEQSLRLAVKRSFQELSRHAASTPAHLPTQHSKALNGDAKTDVAPMFNVVIALERNHGLDVRPSVQALFDMMHLASKELVTVLSAVPRLSQVTAGCAQSSCDARATLPFL
eukprot:scaffold6918_cov380-Prasinococcus_capsulatus_cf.AAC.10